MRTLRTHYDNLKVARNAPPTVIRAAYKALTQAYHPDRHDGDKSASRIMAIINSSYEVLSDPIKRRAHDDWITRQELATDPKPDPQEPSLPTYPNSQPAPKPAASWRNPIFLQPMLLHIGRFISFYAIAGFLVWGALSRLGPPPPGPMPYDPAPGVQTQSQPVVQTKPKENWLSEYERDAEQVPAVETKGKEKWWEDPKLYERPADPAQADPEKYVKPITAPNGRQWPVRAGYVSGYKRLNTNGLSSVTIDNTQNSSDVFVKLVDLAGAEAYPARQIYIPARGKFESTKIAAGSYDIRYRDLDTGSLSRSDSFTLEQTSTKKGTQFSRVTMTLYNVKNGNMRMFPLAESEF